ncbi:MBOAT family O-acyltransferase [Salegentibacter sp. F188]|uniref:MBOAT family O-acyltransferase n=1 Tax=Autumnicola patrickiae TaxID=3075591 RepID=A0ABU3DY09_9FLAO|nr:MBOAT family O-acyltransferase [Salegentibacter sp. F188]MDT0688334.1 MBOAT family O-acyltransferase [Salegentibacter sp. F188]
MLFNSFEFALFFPTVFLLYWIFGGKNIKYQNYLILFSSYFFYGLWDWRFLFLIFLSSLVDYIIGLKIYNTSSQTSRKQLLYFSLFWNLGILFSFKYFNFFTENFYTLFQLDYSSSSFSFLNIILPVGLSFYTFQTLSYSIDIYRERIKPTSEFVEFLCFVSFFPQLVAGPIERASSLLPQFLKKRNFEINMAKEGLRQILWGLFKKIVVADNLAIAVNLIYSDPNDYQSLELFYALILFYFQIYCDFSGYADIAIGSAKLLGFKLSVNFRLPHFSRSIPEFWRRWNITVSVWFRDYVFIPYLKNKSRTEKNFIIATFLTFILIGLWHGAAWTFIFFGLFHAILMIIYRYISIPTRINFTSSFTYYLTNGTFIAICFFFLIISSAFFRGESIQNSFLILKKIFLFIPDENFESLIGLKVLFIPFLLLLEILTLKKDYPFFKLEQHFSKPIRWCIYYLFIFLIIRYGGPQESFIYFQF